MDFLAILFTKIDYPETHNWVHNHCLCRGW